MLIQATADDITKYGDLAYRLALDPATSCYPTYCDGIKTRTDFLSAAEYAVSGATSALWLFSLDGRVEGWLSYDWIPEDHYLQLTSFCIGRGSEQGLDRADRHAGNQISRIYGVLRLSGRQLQCRALSTGRMQAPGRKVSDLFLRRARKAYSGGPWISLYWAVCFVCKSFMTSYLPQKAPG